jgi:tRNA A-37 threonylcarbamoyl transferase component Bud32
MSRLVTDSDPSQGWKLHLPATILSASRLLSRVAPYLRSKNILFKGPKTLLDLKKINTGLFYGYSQVGKFLTVYCPSPETVEEIGQAVHLLTRKFVGPSVPFDERFQGIVFYRYGAFDSTVMVDEKGNERPAIRDPAGTLVPDRREPGAAIPEWCSRPFPTGGMREAKPSRQLAKYRAYEALSQRGKGGVYKALDLSLLPARLCVLKEGRRHGESDVDGSDGASRVRNEKEVLEALRASGMQVVPEPYDGFRISGHYYTAMEYIEGRNLQDILKLRRVPLRSTIQYAKELLNILAAIYDAGFVWRDCKPQNVIVTKQGLRPIDFEGSCRIEDSRNALPFGTQGYLAPEWFSTPSRRSHGRAAEDVYACGISLLQLFSKKAFVPSQRLTGELEFRRDAPTIVRQVVAAMLEEDPTRRITARVAAKRIRGL